MSLPEYFEFLARTKVVFGNGAVREIGKEVSKLSGAKVFLVSDPICRKLGFVDKIQNALAEENLDLAGVFEDVPENSDVKAVEKAYEQAKSGGADCIITMGGGSAMDTAKAVNILLTLGGNLLEDHQGAYTIEQPLQPLIAIPTTAGTGSEMSSAAVIKDTEQKIKITYVSPYLCPNTAILDPELTATMPPWLTAATGMDALTHAIESLHSLSRQPIADSLALHAIRLITKYLPAATKNGENLEARGYMLVAANIAGVAFTNALVGVVHAMSHACGGRCGVHHGMGNSILVPFGMEYNLHHCPDRYSLAAEAMGIDISKLTDVEAGERAIDEVKKFTMELGLPQRLSEVGVKEEDIPALAQDAMSDGCMYNNPREATEEEIAEVFRKAL